MKIYKMSNLTPVLKHKLESKITYMNKPLMEHNQKQQGTTKRMTKFPIQPFVTCQNYILANPKCMFMHWTCFCFGPRTKVNLQMYAKLRHAIIDNQVSPAKTKSESCQQANKRKGACSCRFLINKSQSSCKAPIPQVKMLVLVGVMKYSTHCLPLG